MGEQPGLFQDQFRYGRKVVERARKALFAKKFASFGENALGLIAEAEERFFASRAAALFSECEHLLRRHEVRAGLAGIFSKGAVAAVVAAKSSQWDEDLFRKGDDSSLPAGANFGGCAQEFRQRRSFRE